jgi:ribosomal protein L11 methyltransferase
MIRHSSRELVRITVTTAVEAEEAVVSLMADRLGQIPTVYWPHGTNRILVSVYCSQPSVWDKAVRFAIATGLNKIQQAGLDTQPGTIRVSRVRRENWAESWKRHFKPLAISPRLLIKPSWSKRRPGKHQAVVTIDPGLSFGTGNHPTTAFCLRQIAGCYDPARTQAFLDIGTGSGILAIAAARLGCRPVHAFDNDRDAIRIAKENAGTNRLSNLISFARKDLTSWKPPRHRYDLVCANLQEDLLLAQCLKIVEAVSARGILVLAGLLHSQFRDVQKRYSQEGLCPQTSQVCGQWTSGTFARLRD